jgi:hypothetical protein
VQAGGQDFVDAAILQVGAAAGRRGAGLARLLVGHQPQVVHHLVQAGVQRARHVGAQDQQVGHRSG